MLDFLEDIDIHKIERVSTTLVLKITTLFENGDYENTIKLIEREFTENKYIDVNFLSYLIISQLSLDKSIRNSVAALDSLNNLYQKKGGLLSPNTYINDHIKRSFNKLFKFYLQSLSGDFNIEKPSFDLLNDLDIKLNELNHTIKSCFDIDLSKQDSFILFYRKINNLQKSMEQKAVSDNNNKKKIIENNKYNSVNITESKDVQYKSTKWQYLLRKVEDLKFAIENDDILQISIIYNSLEHELSKFNPKDYFPEIFFDIYLKLSPIMPNILNFTKSNYESIEWYLANNLYSLNPLSFLEQKIDFSSPHKWDDLKFISKNHEKTNNTLIGDYFDYIQNKNDPYKKTTNNEENIVSNETNYSHLYDDDQ